MDKLKQNQFDRINFEKNTISPYGIHIMMKNFNREFNHFVNSDGGDDELHSLSEDDFEYRNLLKYITPEDIAKIYWAIDPEEHYLPIYLKCKELYLTEYHKQVGS